MHIHSTGLISGVTVWLAFLCRALNSCHLPKLTPVSCPSVSCCVSPPMYPLDKSLSGAMAGWHTHKHRPISSAVATLRAFVFVLAEDQAVNLWQFLLCGAPLLLYPLPLCRHLSCCSFHSWPAGKKTTDTVDDHSPLCVFTKLVIQKNLLVVSSKGGCGRDNWRCRGTLRELEQEECQTFRVSGKHFSAQTTWDERQLEHFQCLGGNETVLGELSVQMMNKLI